MSVKVSPASVDLKTWPMPILLVSSPTAPGNAQLAAVAGERHVDRARVRRVDPHRRDEALGQALRLGDVPAVGVPALPGLSPPTLVAMPFANGVPWVIVSQ